MMIFSNSAFYLKEIVFHKIVVESLEFRYNIGVKKIVKEEYG